MRPIDADALKDRMIQAYNDALPEFDIPWKQRLAHTVTLSFMADIDDEPTLAIASVNHGRWIVKPFLLGNSHFCSLCGSNYGMPHEVYNFCPNCGARMDGGADNG